MSAAVKYVKLYLNCGLISSILDLRKEVNDRLQLLRRLHGLVEVVKCFGQATLGAGGMGLEGAWALAWGIWLLFDCLTCLLYSFILINIFRDFPSFICVLLTAGLRNKTVLRFHVDFDAAGLSVFIGLCLVRGVNIG